MGVEIKMRAQRCAASIACGCGTPLLFTAMVFLTACAVSVRESPPKAHALSGSGCIAVLPFDNSSKDYRAGDIIAEMFAGALTVSDYFNIIEPSEVRLILRAQGVRYRPASTPQTARAYGEALGVDRVFMGAVQRFGDRPISGDSSMPIAFSSGLVFVDTAEVAWTGSVVNSPAKSSIQAPSTTSMAQAAVDEIVANLIATRSAVTTETIQRGTCAKRPSLIALERLEKRRAETKALAAKRKGGTVPERSMLPGNGVGLPALPEDELGLPALLEDEFGLPGLPKDELGLPTVPDDEFGLPALAGDELGLPSLPGDESDLPALSGDESDLPGLPGDGFGIPALPGNESDLPALPGDGALPVLPVAKSAEAALAVSAPPALPDIESPSAGADDISVSGAPATEAEGSPFVYASPEPAPTTKAKLSAGQRRLLRQLFSDSRLISRIFQGKGSKLKGAHKRLFRDVAKLLRATQGMAIVFEVHVDIGSGLQARALAEERAAMLKKKLLAKYPDLEDRVFFRAIGDKQPLAKDVSKRARKQNTRVEIRRVYVK